MKVCLALVAAAAAILLPLCALLGSFWAGVGGVVGIASALALMLGVGVVIERLTRP